MKKFKKLYNINFVFFRLRDRNGTVPWPFCIGFDAKRSQHEHDTVTQWSRNRHKTEIYDVYRIKRIKLVWDKISDKNKI